MPTVQPRLAFDAPRAGVSSPVRPPRPGAASLRPTLRRPRSAWREHGAEATRVGLCFSVAGAAGIWGPSCLAAARLAEGELNRGGGIAGRPCEPVLIDAADESADVEACLASAIEHRDVDALVSMSISSVRRRMLGVARGRLPFVYTCLHEGIAASPDLHAIGETAERQLRPSIAWLAAHRRPRRWMLVGNDDVWPRASHRIAARCINEAGAEVVGETDLPFGSTDFSEVLDTLRRSHADAVLISMVGQDRSRFGPRAPTLNSLGESLYEGLHFLAALLGPDGGVARDPTPAAYASARGAQHLGGGRVACPIYLAVADGHFFRVVERL